MNFERRLRQLNREFLRFGLNPFGEQRYKWASTTELVYYIEKGYGENHFGAEWKQKQLRDERGRFAGKIFVPEYRYERHCWADTPLGIRWTMAVWEPPISEEAWRRKFGIAFPWPNRGEYKAIDNMCLDPGEEPNEFWTHHAVLALEIELGMKPREAADAVLKKYHDQQRAIRNEIADELDDCLTAFGKIPGEVDGSVSLPAVRSLIVRRGGTPIEETGETNGNLTSGTKGTDFSVSAGSADTTAGHQAKI